MNERLRQLIDLLKDQEIIYNDADFARKIEKSTSFLSLMINGKKTISHYTINLIKQRFPMVNEDWLLTGEGEMLKKDNHPENEQVLIDRQVLDAIISQQKTIESQQRTIEKLMDAKFQTPVLPEDPAGCAGAAGA